jgi:hypothetical protein
MTSIRILLSVTEGSPELYADLISVPSRLRAERVRALATIGVAAVSGGMNASDHGGSAQGGRSSIPDADLSLSKVQSIAKRLGGGL